MKGIRLIVCAVFCVMTILLTAVPRTQAYTLSTTYTVEIHEDGAASWVIEQSAYLETESDKTTFEALISRAMVYIDQFTTNVSTIIDLAQASTGRFMTAENITVGGNVTESGAGAYGFLEYSFDWTNFALVENTYMTIGDAFSNESFMFGEGELSILLPTGYIVKSCSPSPNQDSNSLLEWNSVESFQNGQPTIQLSKETTNGPLVPSSFSFLLEVTLPVIGAVLASMLVLRARKKKKGVRPEPSTIEAIKEGDNSERIIALLRKEGGQILQSKITEQLKFSKAKTSKILGEMETKGIIKRHKSGRDKVVFLQKEPERIRG